MQEQDLERGIAARLNSGKRIIRQAGEKAKEYFENYETLEVEVKTSRQDLVSEADREVERLIRAEIANAFPLDGLVGEEHGQSEAESDYTWVIDPIDGTSSFLHGLRSWCVVIAVLKEGRPVIGIIYDPMTGQLYHAAEGAGAFRDDRPISVDFETPLSGGFFVVGASRPEQSRHVGQVIEGLLSAGGIHMRNGSAALSLAHVAAGHYLGFYEPQLSSWDCLAGLLLVTEAGGVADDFLVANGLSSRGPAFACAPQAAAQFKALTV